MPEEKKKRVADRQITKDDAPVDDGDDQDNGEVRVLTSVPKADQETLQKRKIVKVARKPDGSVDFSKKKANPFSAVALKTPTAAETTAKPSIFGSSAGFSGFDNNNNNATGFGSAATSTSSSCDTHTNTKPALSFGSAQGFGSLAAASSGGGFSFGKTTEAENESTTKDSTASPAAGTTADTASSFTFANLEDSQSTTTNADGSAKQQEASSLLPTDYKVESGEENEQVLLEVRCKTHRWAADEDAKAADAKKTNDAAEDNANESVPPTKLSFNNGKDSNATSTDETTNDKSPNKSGTESKPSDTASPPQMSWHEVGVGPLRVLQTKQPATTTSDDTLSSSSSSSSSKSTMRLVQRRQVDTSAAVTKVLLNVAVWKESTISQPSEKHVKFTSPPNTMFLFKCGKAETAAQLATLLKTQLAKQPSCFQETTTTTTTTETKADESTKKADKA